MAGLRKFFFLGLALISIQFFAFESNFAQAKKRKPGAKKTAIAKKAAAAKVNLPKVTQIDLVALKNLLKREGENTKPLLINFWATWCDPCREEFPDLVKISADYQGKIDFITISLDELSEIDRDVPKFLAKMKAMMPAYLLKTPDEEAAIETVAKDWQGGLPFTILYDAKGETAFTKQGKVKPDVLRAEIEKVAAVGGGAVNNLSGITNQQIQNLPISEKTEFTYEKGVKDAKDDLSKGKLLIKRYGLTAAIPPQSLKKLKEKYGVEIIEYGCLVSSAFIEYVNGYNETTKAEIRRKFGDKALETLAVK